MTGDQKLKLLYDKIEKEVDYIDVRPFSHNIVGLVLREISEEFGQDRANEAIEHFNLELFGWSKVEAPQNVTK
tara:strand:+ start:332 stop:550 length:219 start_codon:yes stop_codon:yes gene_type:complete